ncbi:MAG: hypothetical protein IPO35_19360 [Uliginosibacterium sp.]|nr:hypothetical protein [Uliginosibacterium sp.]
MCIATVFGMNLRSRGLEELPVIAFWLVFGVAWAWGCSSKAGWNAVKAGQALKR